MLYSRVCLHSFIGKHWPGAFIRASLQQVCNLAGAKVVFRKQCRIEPKIVMPLLDQTPTEVQLTWMAAGPSPKHSLQGFQPPLLRTAKFQVLCLALAGGSILDAFQAMKQERRFKNKHSLQAAAYRLFHIYILISV